MGWEKEEEEGAKMSRTQMMRDIYTAAKDENNTWEGKNGLER